MLNEDQEHEVVATMVEEPEIVPIDRCSCGGQMEVIDSRSNLDYKIRRRKCKDCGERVTTYEYRYKDKYNFDPKFPIELFDFEVWQLKVLVNLAKVMFPRQSC